MAAFESVGYASWAAVHVHSGNRCLRLNAQRPNMLQPCQLIAAQGPGMVMCGHVILALTPATAAGLRSTIHSAMHSNTQRQDLCSMFAQCCAVVGVQYMSACWS